MIAKCQKYNNQVQQGASEASPPVCNIIIFEHGHGLFAPTVIVVGQNSAEHATCICASAGPGISFPMQTVKIK
jgi:hypothetical protein